MVWAFDVSVLSVVRLIREVVPSMRERKWGRILTIQSTSVKQPVEGLLLSNAVRPGVAGLAKTLAPELGKDNITINLVLPGRIMTDRFLSGAGQPGVPLEDYLKTASTDIPLGRVGSPEEFANVLVFLASERVSYVTGVTLQVDGGVVRGQFRGRAPADGAEGGPPGAVERLALPAAPAADPGASDSAEAARGAADAHAGRGRRPARVRVPRRSHARTAPGRRGPECSRHGDPGGIRTRDLDLERVASWARLDDGVSDRQYT